MNNINYSENPIRSVTVMKSDDLNNKETNKLSINNFSNVLIKENNLCISETGSYINLKMLNLVY